MAGHFEAILALLDGYALWLHSGRQADNLVARIGTVATAPFPQIDPRTRDQYLRLLKLYLSWCVTRYIPRARQTSTSLANIEVVFADVADLEGTKDSQGVFTVRLRIVGELCGFYRCVLRPKRANRILAIRQRLDERL
ncbi:hypothetical protein D3C79_825680 [compost metagenome]